MPTSQSGFSLVELTVSVAIIGTMAAVAIPNMNQYAAKARTRGAESEMAGVEMIAKNYYSLTSRYPDTISGNANGINLLAIGRVGSIYAPTGGCGGISDASNPENAEALQAICRQIDRVPSVPYNSTVCNMIPNQTFRYIGGANGGYKITLICGLNSHLSSHPDPVRDGGPNLTLVDGTAVWSYGFWTRAMSGQ